MARWYATSPVPERIADRPGVDPALSVVHAKELGTTVTACGKRAGSWFPHWKAFHKIASSRACRDCTAILRTGVGGGGAGGDGRARR